MVIGGEGGFITAGIRSATVKCLYNFVLLSKKVAASIPLRSFAVYNMLLALETKGGTGQYLPHVQGSLSYEREACELIISLCCYD
jgi:hypothetical protein